MSEKNSQDATVLGKICSEAGYKSPEEFKTEFEKWCVASIKAEQLIKQQAREQTAREFMTWLIKHQGPPKMRCTGRDYFITYNDMADFEAKYLKPTGQKTEKPRKAVFENDPKRMVRP